MPVTPAASRPKTVAEIDTPALIVDLPSMERNIARMAEFFKDLPSKPRPHAKTHKTPQIALRQIAAGAIGITCAKLDEAEVMLRAGVPSVLIANQIVGPPKTARAARLERLGELILSLDSAGNARELDAAAGREGVSIYAIIEIDVGMGRSGTRSPEETLSLAREIISLPNLRFRGLMGYEGHAVMIPEREKRVEAAQKANSTLVAHAEYLRANGVPVEIVSAGGTGTYAMAGTHPGITEVQMGSFVTMDANYKRLIPEFENALTVLCTVISRPTPDRAILDCGMKALTKDFMLPLVKGGGAEVIGLSEEHATLKLDGLNVSIGDRVELIPGHGCTTFNLHDEVFVVQENQVTDVWPIAARGGFH